MNYIQTIAVIGGTGKSGKYLVRQLITQGYSVRLLHRHPETLILPTPPVEIIQGDARDYASIHALLKGCDAVMSTLGQPKGETSIFSDACRNIIRAMQERGIKRYIVTTGLSVDAAGDHKHAEIAAATEWMKQHYPETTVDKQVEYSLLSESNLDWTMVRLPLIELTEEEKSIHVQLNDCPGNNISATSLALFLIRQLSSEQFLKQAPFIANVK